MKRFNILDVSTFESTEALISEDPEGEWVRWKDVKELLGRLGHKASVAGFHSRISNLENFICRAHGYKKL